MALTDALVIVAEVDLPHVPLIALGAVDIEPRRTSRLARGVGVGLRRGTPRSVWRDERRFASEHIERRSEQPRGIDR